MVDRLTEAWQSGPLTDRGEVLRQRPEARFHCPVSDEDVAWAAKDVFNPAAVVRDGRVHLLFRGEDEVGRYSGTSRIGLAVSEDGMSFAVDPEPVLFPAEDAWQPWEWPGGCEDPRLVESPEGGYVCTYTAFDGKSSCLFVATSDDLRHWDKQGPAFGASPYVRKWSKSGAMVTEVRDGRLVAANIGGRYWMYWGEGTCYGATSTDLVRWTPIEFDAGADRYLTYRPHSEAGSWGVNRVTGQRVLRPLLLPRRGRYDSLLVEPGPPAVVTSQGVVLVYNGAQLVPGTTEGTTPSVVYQPGQVLFDPLDPASPIARDNEPCVRREELGDLDGQVDNVCFAEGLVLFEGNWLLYYGMADSRIGCASAPSKF